MKELLSRFNLNGSILKFWQQRFDLGMTVEAKVCRSTRLPSFIIRVTCFCYLTHNLRAKEASRAFAKTLIENCLFLAQGITFVFVCFPAPCVTIILCRGGCAEAVSKNISIPFITSGVFNEFSRVLIVICFIIYLPSILFSVTPLTSLLNAK